MEIENMERTSFRVDIVWCPICEPEITEREIRDCLGKHFPDANTIDVREV
jgi:hypothetical protein